MTFLRRLFGLDFPDPATGQVWRSLHSGRAIRVAEVRTSDCGKLWHISLQHETDRGEFNPLPLSYCMFPAQWRRMLRAEARRLMGGGLIEPSRAWPRGGNVNPAPTYAKPPAPPRPPVMASHPMRDGYLSSALVSDENGHKLTLRFATREQADAAQAWLADGVEGMEGGQKNG